MSALISAAVLATVLTVGCAAENAEPPCERICGDGLECKRVPDPYIEGVFAESCVPISKNCEPACATGQVCENKVCVKTCSPECPNYRVCDDGECAKLPAGLGCSQILDCIGDCTPGDGGVCGDACAADGNATGSYLFTVYAKCITDNGCTDSNCIITNCNNVYRACLGLPPTCDPACQAGFACSANATCDPIGGEQCSPPCQPGSSCVDGMCQLGGGCGAGNSATCIGKVLQTCQNGSMVSIDCSKIDPQCVCAYIPPQQTSDCVCDQGGQPCNPPCPFGTTCINGICEQ